MLDIIAKIPVKYPFKKHTRKHTHMGTPQRSQIFNCRRNLIKKKKTFKCKEFHVALCKTPGTSLF